MACPILLLRKCILLCIPELNCTSCWFSCITVWHAAAQCWQKGLYQYLSSQVQLQAGSDYAQPHTLSLMQAQNTASGTNISKHGPSTQQTALLTFSPSLRSLTMWCMTVVQAHHTGSGIDLSMHVPSMQQTALLTFSDHVVHIC